MKNRYSYYVTYKDGINVFYGDFKSKKQAKKAFPDLYKNEILDLESAVNVYLMEAIPIDKKTVSSSNG